jgi:hypothetical protein
MHFERVDEQAQFTIDLPPAWDYVDTSPAVREASIQGFLDRHAPMAHWEINNVNNLGRSDGVWLLAYDFSPEMIADGLTTYLILSDWAGHGATTINEEVGLLMEDRKQNVEFLVADSLKHQRMSLGSTEAEEIQFEQCLSGAGHFLNVAYLVPRNSGFCYVEFWSPADAKDRNLPLFREIAQTFRLLKAPAID